MKSAARRNWIIGMLVCAAFSESLRAADPFLLVGRPWFAARTPHFQTYSCGPTQAVARLAARLEQFRLAYETLAGTQAVASPPIEVMVFPDHDWLEQFVPLYQGRGINVSGFFHRGSDENLIVLSLANHGPDALETIFHEYGHLLLRRNQQFWPMWLNEGMADIYATFEVTADHSVRVGKPQEIYLSILATQPLSPLASLFAVTRDSPDYNERDRQGIFYAESWLLTHYLMIGNPACRAGLAQLTVLLRQGQASEQAFTNAFHTSLPAFEKELARYAHQGRLQSLDLTVRANLRQTQPMATRSLGPAEICFRLGDELLRVGRDTDAESFFNKAAKLAPANSLATEGLGLLAAERGQHQQAMEQLAQAIHRGSTSFLAHYEYARQKLILSSPTPDSYARLAEPAAAEVRNELETALKLMPQFGPAQHLLGFFQLIEGDDLTDAAQHVRNAIDLEPDNPGYPFTLAEIQMAQHNPADARRTLEPLCRPYVNARLRARAQEMLKAMGPLER